jgi:hypothetical protein
LPAAAGSCPTTGVAPANTNARAAANERVVI